MKKLQLTSEKIYEKSFNVDFKGYTPAEVDAFLDTVISDYEQFENAVNNLEMKLAHYEGLISELSEANQSLQGKLNSLQQVDNEGSFVDLIRRVARLEEVVFKD